MNKSEREDDIFRSHAAISKSISDFGAVLKEHGDTINLILAQTTKTNGSVKSLQLWQAGVKGWIAGVGICLSVILVLVSVVFYSEIGGVKSLINQHIMAQAKTP